jgi:hypothetical protein
LERKACSSRTQFLDDYNVLSTLFGNVSFIAPLFSFFVVQWFYESLSVSRTTKEPAEHCTRDVAVTWRRSVPLVGLPTLDRPARTITMSWKSTWLCRGGPPTFWVGRRYDIGAQTLLWILPHQPHLLFEHSRDFMMWVAVFRPQLVQPYDGESRVLTCA